MLLRIQREESLRSFLARSFYVNRYSPAIAELKKNANFGILSERIEEIGKAMGWLGCYGFNRLLHNHTFYPRTAFLHEEEDISYSGREYHSSVCNFELATTPSLFCPECVRDDIAYLGFSYWRREHHPQITVCAKHNVCLESKCPFCLKPFSHKNHELDVMWKGCKGFYLSETPSRKNHKASELKKAKFFRDVFSFDSVISIEAVRSALTQRAGDRRPHVREKLVAAKYLHEFIKILCDEFGDYWNFEDIYVGDNCRVWGFVLTFYGGFEDFLSHLKCNDYRPRKVESLWSTYESGTYQFVQYTREDYVYGVGHWSSTLSSKQLSEYRGDYSGRPVDYRCCNEVSPFYKTRSLQPRPVSSPPPSVPILLRHPSEY